MGRGGGGGQAGTLGLCQAWLAFAMGALPGPGSRTLLPKASRGPAVLTLHPGSGNSHASACPWPGAPVLGAGCLQPSAGPSPSLPSPLQPWRRGQPCSSRPRPGREPGSAPLAWRLGRALLAHSSGTPWTCVPHPLWSPCLTCQLAHEVSPALVRSFRECLQTPPTPPLLPISCLLACCCPCLPCPLHTPGASSLSFFRSHKCHLL